MKFLLVLFLHVLTLNLFGQETATLYDQLETLNSIFEQHSKFENKWSVDTRKKLLINKTANCQVDFKLKKIKSIQKYKRDYFEPYDNGVKIITKRKGILEKCDNYAKKTFFSHEYLDDVEWVDSAIVLIRDIKKRVLKGEAYIPKTFIPTEDTTDIITQNLIYLNDQFGYYGTETVTFEVNESKNQLILKEDCCNTLMGFNDLSIAYDGKGFNFTCPVDEPCFNVFIKEKGRRFNAQNVYLPLVDKEGNPLPQFTTILMKFEEIKSYLLASGVEQTNVEPQLSALNDILKRNNKYNTRFSIEDNMLMISDDFGTKSVECSNVEVKIYEKTNLFGLYTLNKKNEIKTYDESGEITSQLSRYTLGFSKTESAKNDLIKARDLLNAILKSCK